MKSIVASGHVIIEDGKLLVIKDNKDDFYKIPGGTAEEGETLEQTCMREVKEETNADIEIIKPLSTMIIHKNPTTKEEMEISLYHHKVKVKNLDKLKAGEGHEMKWLNIEDIKAGKYDVAPNIKYLIEQGDIK